MIIVSFIVDINIFLDFFDNQRKVSLSFRNLSELVSSRLAHLRIMGLDQVA